VDPAEDRVQTFLPRLPPAAQILEVTVHNLENIVDEALFFGFGVLRKVHGAINFDAKNHPRIYPQLRGHNHPVASVKTDGNQRDIRSHSKVNAPP